MERDWSKWEAWEREHIASTPVDFERNLKWADAALQHARLMGVFPPQDPLEGLEEKIEWVKRLHTFRNSSVKPLRR